MNYKDAMDIHEHKTGIYGRMRLSNNIVNVDYDMLLLFLIMKLGVVESLL
jgi:hypothetical protein